MNPFDWPAEPFLKLYGFLAVALFTIGFTVRASIGSGAARLPGLNELEWAYLAGGADRVCDVALLCLASANAATIADKGAKIVVTDGSPMTSLAGAGSAAPVGTFTRKAFRAEIAPLTNRIRRRLQALGLTPTDDEMNTLRWSVLPFVVLLLAFGATKAYVGASRDHPIGFLLVLMFATIIGAAFMLTRPMRTRAGSQALGAHQSANARAARAPLDRELLLAVALSGSVVLSGTAYASIHEARQASSNDGGGGCGGGGGGCGGGGCGGCS